MAKVVVAPNRYRAYGAIVFLAGAIDMGEAENWQAKVITMLDHCDHLTIFNPRRKEFKPEMEDEQIKWELKALDKSDFILMWFPKNSEAPISFLEFGLYLTSNKLLVGVEDGFYRKRNIELTAQRYKVKVSHSLDVLVDRLRQQIKCKAQS